MIKFIESKRFSMKVLVYGLGYVGLSLATLLAQKNDVRAVDINEERVRLVNNSLSPIKDLYIEDFLKNKKSIVSCSVDTDDFSWADFVIIATPTNYDVETNSFDTSSIEFVLENLSKHNSKSTIVIKSTIPIGYTDKVREKFSNLEILFSPEFLREGKALEDNLFPSRIIVGYCKDERLKEKAVLFGELLNSCAIEKTSVITMWSKEAEAIKLFSNTYLAVRVAYFNELDTYCELNGLNSENIIKGMCKDKRIGDFYNNPSFGYGGYCLPKDTKQLLYEFLDVPNDMIKAVVASNSTRAKFCAERIFELAKNKSNKPVIGIYRLIMKAGSDNFRSSSIQNVIEELKKIKVEIVIFEPTLRGQLFNGIKIENNFDCFEKMSTIIVANRIDKQLESVKGSKVYTRDIYKTN